MPRGCCSCSPSTAAKRRASRSRGSAGTPITSRALYVASDGEPEDQEADFLSYRQLIETVGVPEGRPVTFRDFAGFFERHRQKIRFADAHQAFEELRGVLTAEPEGPLSREAYLGLAVRQSMFDGEQRALLFDLFQRYRAS